MSLMLDEDEAFSLTAYVESLGEQRIALTGYLVSKRSDGTYVAPLIPDLFYGADGNQLQHSWKQDFTATGSQVILSRSGGLPEVPRQDLYWRKVETRTPETQAIPTEAIEEPKVVSMQTLSWILPVALIGGLLVVGLFIYKSQ